MDVGQRKILLSKVLIVGAGGLGSPVAEFVLDGSVMLQVLLIMIKLILSNLHRQSLYNSSDIGKYKVKMLIIKSNLST